MKFLSIAMAGLLAAAVGSAAGQSTAVPTAPSALSSPGQAASANTPASLQHRNERYRLRKGDSFDLDFTFSPEFNQNVVVQPDGYITLKGAGSYYVEGQTIPDLDVTVKTAYAKILHDPIIAIAPKEFERPYFIAAGQVQRPGKYELRSALTVTQGVAIAGGFNEKSKNTDVVLYHPNASGGFDAKVLNIKKLLASKNLSEDPRLEPGDMVYVPQTKFSHIRPFLPNPSAGVGTYFDPAIK